MAAPASRAAEAIAPQVAQVINAVQVLVRDEQGLDLPRYGFKDPCGSCVGGGDAVVWSDFRLTEDGTNRFLFINRRLNAYRQGRMIRRLLEIETYRMMASLTLATAKALSQELDTSTRRWSASRSAVPGGTAMTPKGYWTPLPTCHARWSATR